MSGDGSAHPAAGRVRVGGAPPGQDVAFVAELAQQSDGGILHIVENDRRLAEAVEALAFRCPALPVLAFPAWDCQPYDRISPRPEIIGLRVGTLTRLASEVHGPHAVIATVNAVLQRVPPRIHARAGRWSARVGTEAESRSLVQTLAWNGYSRVSTVRGLGEFAVRGGIVDVFAAGWEWPVRLEFAWDQLETIRSFDPQSQRSAERLDEVEFALAGEVALDPESVSRFRQSYLRMFGIPRKDDPLYVAVGEGRQHQGMEHWLPLFHDGLETLFDYLPAARVVLDEHVASAAVQRFEAVGALYEAREREHGEGDGPVYRPCPPELLYLDSGEWESRLAGRACYQLHSGRVPDDARCPDQGARIGRDFAGERTAPEGDVFRALAIHLRRERAAGRNALLAAYSEGSRERMMTAIERAGCDIVPVESWEEFERVSAEHRRVAAAAVWRLPQGFETDTEVVVSEQDVLGTRMIARRGSRVARSESDRLRTAEDLEPGDLVVHEEFGLGKFVDLASIDVGGTQRNCLTLEYAGGDLLRVPVENIDLLYRYGEGTAARLDRLGAAGWQARKAEAKNRIREIAADLLRIAAERELRTAPAVAPPDDGYDEFCARFPFAETEDQIDAVKEMLADIGSGKPMDRLICGDVGFGKTEVALRAAFAVAESGAQVAVLAPTTLLARQLFRVFSERFAGFPVEIRQLTRFTGAGEATRTREELADGTVSIVIGTHALLSEKIRFRNIGLAIIDEEQQFGVRQKERLKSLRSDSHVLTMTATPIPRTLNLALSGIRPMSIIATPPIDRLAVRTYVLPFDRLTVREAFLRERRRGGQSFFLVPRISDLPAAAEFLRDHVPEVSFTQAHGRLPGDKLEARMNRFYDGAEDVLLSTTIIASGLDMPRVNTLVVQRSDRFGLAQLYQIRGRVGRSNLRAYAYFTTDPSVPLTASAARRLEALTATEELGAGFTLASRDLDIRGAGNLLGSEQAGHIREVGTELYRQMLEQEVYRLRAEGGDSEAAKRVEDWSPVVDIGVPIGIPETYISDLGTRMRLYRRLAGMRAHQEVEDMAVEIRDRFGPVPSETVALCETLELKLLCRKIGIARIEAGTDSVRLQFRHKEIANPAGLVNLVSSRRDVMSLKPDGTLILRQRFSPAGEKISAVRSLCQTIGESVASRE